VGAPRALAGSDGVLVNVAADSICHYKGLTVRETAGADAIFRIRVNSTSGSILETIALAAGDSVTMWFDGRGKLCAGDLYEDYVSGTYEGSVFVL
jgi:hypothetical protein